MISSADVHDPEQISDLEISGCITEASALASASLACATTLGGKSSGLVVDSLVVVAEFEFVGACVSFLASPTIGGAVGWTSACAARVCSSFWGNSALGSSLDVIESSFFVSTPTTTTGALSTVGVDWMDNGSSWGSAFGTTAGSVTALVSSFGVDGGVGAVTVTLSFFASTVGSVLGDTVVGSGVFVVAALGVTGMLVVVSGGGDGAAAGFSTVVVVVVLGAVRKSNDLIVCVAGLGCSLRKGDFDPSVLLLDENCCTLAYRDKLASTRESALYRSSAS